MLSVFITFEIPVFCSITGMKKNKGIALQEIILLIFSDLSEIIRLTREKMFKKRKNTEQPNPTIGITIDL